MMHAKNIFIFFLLSCSLLLGCKKLEIDPSNSDEIWHVDSYEIKSIDPYTGQLQVGTTVKWETLRIRNFSATEYRYAGTANLVSDDFSGPFLEFESERDLADETIKSIFVFGDADPAKYDPIEKIFGRRGYYEGVGFEMQYSAENELNFSYVNSTRSEILIRRIGKNKMRIIMNSLVAISQNQNNLYEFTYELSKN